MYCVVLADDYSPRAADEPAGRGAVAEHDPADVGRAGDVARRADRQLRAVLQRLALPRERARDDRAAAQRAPAHRPHARHRLPRTTGRQVGARRGRQHADRTSPHARLRYVATSPHFSFLWPPYGIGQAIIFSSCGFYLLLLLFLA